MSTAILDRFSPAAPPTASRQCIFEMTHQRIGALNASISQLTYFTTVKLVPPAAAELLVKGPDVLRVHKIDKGIAHVALIVGVERQVQEINLVFELSRQLVE